MEEQEVIDKISVTMQAINLIYSVMNKIKPSLEQLEVINKRHELLIDQEKFWNHQNNPQRFLYDLQEFGHWLYEYLDLKQYEDINIEL
tara:strand:+ start:3163 stop:3426 length:264 start_codon:yes stop_codon:yes gene_type:complete